MPHSTLRDKSNDLIVDRREFDAVLGKLIGTPASSKPSKPTKARTKCSDPSGAQSPAKPADQR
jgi:hypothetical protein